VVDRTEALAQLPRAHALALRLRDLGAGNELIADCLDVGVETVGPLLEIALAKLTHIQESDVPAGRPDPAAARAVARGQATDSTKGTRS
jgi:hypothetical protein